MPLSASPPTGPTLIQVLSHLLATVGQVSCPDQLARGVVEYRQAGGLRAGINLEPQGLQRRLVPHVRPDNGERKPSPDCGVARVEQISRSAGMHRVKWSSHRIKDKHPGHDGRLQF
jgi:hypothetical protein